MIDHKNKERIILVTENKKASHLEIQRTAKKNQISELTIPKKIITSLEIPVDEKWKAPFNTLLSDLKRINQDLKNKKRGQDEKVNKIGSSIPQAPTNCEVCDD